MMNQIDQLEAILATTSFWEDDRQNYGITGGITIEIVSAPNGLFQWHVTWTNRTPTPSPETFPDQTAAKTSLRDFLARTLDNMHAQRDQH